MERFMAPQPRTRNASSTSQKSQHSDQAAAVNDNIMEGMGTFPLLLCETRMSLDSNDSPESNPTVETDSSKLSQNSSWNITLFFKVMDNKNATCTKCSKTLKIQQGTNSNLKIHYQRYHPGQFHDLKAALAGASKRGRHKYAAATTPARKQASIEESFKEKLPQKKCLDLYYRYNVNLYNKATCTKCSKTLKIQQGTNSNLKIHYQRYHPGEVHDLKAALADASKRGRHKNLAATTPTRKQATIEESYNEKFSQKKCLDLYYRSFISCMKPASETDNEHNKALWAYACPQFKVPSRRKLTRDIRAMGDQAKADLMDLLAKQDFVATTADSWSASNRAFLGMTVTWLDKAAFKRHSAVLGIKEITVSQTGTYLAEAIFELHDKFGIKRKVVSTTTDNGANYISDFNRNIERDAEQQEQDVVDPEEVHTSTILVEDALEEVDQQEEVVQLPKHRRCAAHTVNLLTEVLDLEKRNKLNQICQQQHPHSLLHITQDDMQIWSEYLKVTAPLTACLDVLQSEEKAYMGCLLPHLQVLKDSLEALSRDDSTVHAQNLAAHLLQPGTKGFDGRFSHLFVDMDLLMATALHPYHKLATVRAICRRQDNEVYCDMVRDKLIKDLLALVQPDEHLDPAPQQGPQPGFSSTDYLFAMEDGQQEESLEEKVREEVNNWSKKPLRGNPMLSPNLFPLEFRDAWVTLFLKYNTPLPSSASIKRVFSYGSDILRPKRAALAAPNFEALVFMKGNLDLLKKADEVEEEDKD